MPAIGTCQDQLVAIEARCILCGILGPAKLNDNAKMRSVVASLDASSPRRISLCRMAGGARCCRW